MESSKTSDNCISGKAIPMLASNIDTDKIIPSVEMKKPSKEGLSDGLFANQRYLPPIKERKPNPSFILNKPEYTKNTIIISKDNFGCGSSREHAVWALKEYGIKAVIATSFARIFHDNCINNLIAPIQINSNSLATLLDKLKAGTIITINLANKTIQTNYTCITFTMADSNQKALINQQDKIETIVKNYAPIIDTYEIKAKKATPWLFN